MSEEQKIGGSLCDVCHSRDVLAGVQRPIDGYPGVTDALIVCTVCGRVEHASFMSTKLEQISQKVQRERRPGERDKLLRYYRRQFKSLQNKMMGQVVKATVYVGQAGAAAV